MASRLMNSARQGFSFSRRSRILTMYSFPRSCSISAQTACPTSSVTLGSLSMKRPTFDLGPRPDRKDARGGVGRAGSSVRSAPQAIDEPEDSGQNEAGDYTGAQREEEDEAASLDHDVERQLPE